MDRSSLERERETQSRDDLFHWVPYCTKERHRKRKHLDMVRPSLCPSENHSWHHGLLVVAIGSYLVTIEAYLTERSTQPGSTTLWWVHHSSIDSGRKQSCRVMLFPALLSLFLAIHREGQQVSISFLEADVVSLASLPIVTCIVRRRRCPARTRP
jgi:hypothetical protein